MDEMERLQDDERDVARRLEAYADARLRPDPVAMLRVRSAIVAEARGPGAVPSRRWRWRLGGALLAAALLVVGMVGVVAASQAGGPLYGTRLWAESMTLPTQPSARAAAQLVRLDQRLQEVQAALAAHDAGAAAAALDAYRSILDETVAATPASTTEDERLQADIAKHLAVLQALLATAPRAAVNGLQNAIEHSDHGLQQIEQRAAGTGPGSAPGNSSAPGQNGTAPGQSSAPGQNGSAPGHSSAPGQNGTAPQTGASPKPSPSPKASPSPKPSPSAPAASVKPAKP
jgi:hypothetical protein